MTDAKQVTFKGIIEEAPDKRRPLVLFTGGVDSTLMLHQLLLTSNVDIMYVNGHQGDPKYDKEQLARGSILKEIEGFGLPYKVQRLYHFELKGNWELLHDHTHQAVLRRDTFHRNVVLPQALHWMFAAMSTMDPQEHSGVHMGYLSGDSIMSRYTELKSTWEWLCLLILKESIPLVLSLAEYNKVDVLDRIDPRLYRHTWSCEGQTEEPCGRCTPCVTRIGAIAAWEAKHQDSYAEYHQRQLGQIALTKAEPKDISHIVELPTEPIEIHSQGETTMTTSFRDAYKKVQAIDNDNANYAILTGTIEKSVNTPEFLREKRQGVYPNVYWEITVGPAMVISKSVQDRIKEEYMKNGWAAVIFQERPDNEGTDIRLFAPEDEVRELIHV
jgi:hypothetical protein